MSDKGKLFNYLFILAIGLMILAYWAGANQLLKTSFAGVNQIDLTATGRLPNGQFAGYPSGGPAA